MAKISVDELDVGMVLASDLFGPNERFLLGAGTLLEEKHLQILKAWGVAEADVENVSQEEVAQKAYGQFDADCLLKSRQRVDRWFAHTNRDHEAVAELYRLSVLHTAKQIQGETAGPAEEGEPEESIGSAGEADDRESPLKVTAIISDHVQFASLPDTFVKISEAINNPRSSAGYIASIISADISLSAKLLKLVNSAFYGFPQKISSLAQAVTILGNRQLASLAMGVSLVSHFKDIPGEILDMRSFWQHSLCCGIVARLLAGNHKDRNEEAFFVAGLLHDAGRLVVLQSRPASVLKVLQRSRQKGVLPHAVEPEIWGMDHAKIAGMLFERWKFPSTLESAVRFHHAPGEALSSIEPAIVHLADIITHAMGVGKSGNRYVPALDPQVWSELGISKNVLSPLVTQAEYQQKTLEGIILS